MKTILITSIPSPYRITVFDELHKKLNGNFTVFYTSRTHPSFGWKENKLNHNHHFINENEKTELGQIKGIYKKLKSLNPDIIITCGFTPQMLRAMLYALLHKKKLVANTDAWEINEKTYSIFHILIRKLAYKHMHAFIPVSKKGYANFLSYRIKKEKIFVSHYAIDNDYSLKFVNSDKKYDILFSGQFIDRKMPLFFCEVAELLSRRNKNVKILMLGDGELKEQVINRLKINNVDFTYLGFVQKEELPYYYASSKIFLFPTKLDSWGVVANDACAVGTPVITCTNAGAADDLIINDLNGYVLPLDSKLWVEHIELLLRDKEKYNLFSANCLNQIKKYNPKEAADAIIAVMNFLK